VGLVEPFLTQIIRAVHGKRFKTKGEGEVRDHAGLVRRIAFIDLKNTGGGHVSSAGQVMGATQARRSEIIKRIRYIDPTHMAVAGKKAQPAFDTYIFDDLRRGTVTFKIYHPSCRQGLTMQEYYEHVRGHLKEGSADNVPSVGLTPLFGSLRLSGYLRSLQAERDTHVSRLGIRVQLIR